MSLIKRMSPDEKKESGIIALCLMLLILAHFIPKKYNDSSVHSNLYYFSLSDFKRSDRKYPSW